MTTLDSRSVSPARPQASCVGCLFAGIEWDERDGFGQKFTLRAQVQMPVARQRLLAVFERALGDTRMLRWGNHLPIAEATDGMRWNTNLTLFNALSARRAVALRRSIRGATGREVNPVEYQLPLIHRQRIFREWLFLEVRGGGGWIRQELCEPREFVPEAAVVHEMSSGRHPRERVREVP